MHYFGSADVQLTTIFSSEESPPPTGNLSRNRWPLDAAAK